MNKDGTLRRAVLITRPLDQSRELKDAILATGHHVYELPVIDIAALPTAAVARAMDRLEASDIVVFVSPNAVRYGASVVTERTAAADRPLFAAIGPSTASALKARGIAVDMEPQGRSDSENLLEHAALQRVAGKTITIVRGTQGRERLQETLTVRGAHVQYLAVYERRTATPAATLVQRAADAVRAGKIDAVVVMSVDSLNGLLQILPDDVLPQLRQSLLVTPSKRVIQTVSDRFSDLKTALADGPLATQLVAALLKYREDTL